MFSLLQCHLLYNGPSNRRFWGYGSHYEFSSPLGQVELCTFTFKAVNSVNRSRKPKNGLYPQQKALLFWSKAVFSNFLFLWTERKCWPLLLFLNFCSTPHTQPYTAHSEALQANIFRIIVQIIVCKQFKTLVCSYFTQSSWFLLFSPSN